MKTYPPDDLLITVSRWGPCDDEPENTIVVCDYGECHQIDNGSGYCDGHAWRWWNKWYRRLWRWVQFDNLRPDHYLKRKTNG